MHKPKHHYKHSGNAVVFVLLAVVLFGALIFTITNSGQKNVSRVSETDLKLQAQRIIYYAQSLERAVQRVRSKGCSESQISFENSTDTVYVNPNAPPDKSCHVFDPAGGQMKWENIGNNRMITASTHCIIGIGRGCNGLATSGAELLFLTRFTGNGAEALCQEINYQLGTRAKGATVPEENLSQVYTHSVKFKGTYGSPPNIGTNYISGAGLSNFPASCFLDTVGNPGGYNMYYTLLPR